MSEATVTRPPRRADAQRNYEIILATARTAIAERGGNIVLEDIARDAGVGIGTLYRHFPTRQDLLEAAFIDEALELRARAVALADAPSSFDALVSWLRLQRDFGAHGRSMGAAVMNAKHTEGTEIQIACASMRDAGVVLLQHAQAAGEVRADVELIDVLRLMHGIVLANEQAPDARRVEGMFDLVIAGIRT
ncbi:MAG TPA: helix-turn-helix domain-containing protein [Acidimicrobiales bacterium]